MPNREDSVLDEIDRLVDWQMSEGDRSDSYHGEQFRENQPCPWCDEGWHFLPITETMRAMRAGSYATDEFGAGIVDPDYRYENDESMILCPGSEFHGPAEVIRGVKVWDKQGRERAQKRSTRLGRPFHPTPASPSLPPGRLRRLRFHGPFAIWTIALENNQTIEPDPYGRNPPIIREQELIASFELQTAIRNPSLEWLERNMHEVVDQEVTMNGAGTFVQMKPVAIPFRSFTAHAENPRALEPDWIEFETTYPIERHSWFMGMWVMSGTSTDVSLRPINQPREGFEADYVIIDEAYEFGEEDLRRHVEETIRNRSAREASD